MSSPYRVNNVEDAKGEIEALKKERSLLLRFLKLISTERDRLRQMSLTSSSSHASAHLSLK